MAPRDLPMRVQCQRAGCKGSCPLDVVQNGTYAGLSPDCKVCGMVYRKPAQLPGGGARSTAPWKQGSEGKANGGLEKQ
eukprot:6046405-Heterocapsa_arctica.AAC.1